MYWLLKDVVFFNALQDQSIKLLYAKKIFESTSSIHGFVISGIKNLCAAFGGKEICLFNISPIISANKTSGVDINISTIPAAKFMCKDWIMDVRYVS